MIKRQCFVRQLWIIVPGVTPGTDVHVNRANEENCNKQLSR